MSARTQEFLNKSFLNKYFCNIVIKNYHCSKLKISLQSSYYLCKRIQAKDEKYYINLKKILVSSK